MTRRRALAGTALAVLLGAPLLAQRQDPPPTPTFRAGVELVQIDAVVADRNGNPVSGLTVDDFELSEAGKPRDISAFATVDIPIDRAERVLYSPTAIEPDVASNSGPEGRVYVIAFDEVAADMALRTRHFIRRFIETQMGANDVAAIAYLGMGAAHSQDFTGSKRLLLTQLDKFTGGFPPNDPQFNMQNRMATLRDLTQMLATIQGRRKAMLLVSTGDTLADSYDIVDNTGSTIATDYLREAMIAATRGNVVIYPIDPRGLTVGGGTGDEETPGTGASLESVSNLRALARLTGGFAVTNTNRYEANFERVVRENSSYYILGFYSAIDKRDGKFRSVDVRVTRPGMEVRARTGYVAPQKPSRRPDTPKSALTADTTAALASALARRDLPMKLFTAPYKGSGKDAIVSVVVEFDPATLDLVERDGLLTGQLEIGITATNGGKQMPGVNHVADLKLKRDRFDIGRREGMRIVSELLLPPGMYQVRAAAGNRQNKAGSVIADLEVPDFRKDPLRMSGVAISSARVPAPLTVRAGETRAPLPSLPTTSREFSAGDIIEVFAEVYDNIRTNASHTVDLAATLRADDGRVLLMRTEQRSSSELGGSSGGFGFRAEFPLTGIAPGLYVIHVEARANTGARPVVSRDVQIRVQ